MNPEGLVFATREGGAFDRHNLTNRQLKSTCKKLELVGMNWHWLHHANATLLDAVGTPLGTVQALLGHSSSEITREVYLPRSRRMLGRRSKKLRDCGGSGEVRPDAQMPSPCKAS